MSESGSEQPTANRPRGKGKPFAKGDPRINRQGKSKELAELEREFRQTIIEELCRPDEYDPEPDPEKRRTNFQSLVRRWVELAKGGNLGAIEGLIERILGKPVQPVGGVEGQPIEYRIVTNARLPRAGQ